MKHHSYGAKRGNSNGNSEDLRMQKEYVMHLLTVTSLQG